MLENGRSALSGPPVGGLMTPGEESAASSVTSSRYARKLRHLLRPAKCRFIQMGRVAPRRKPRRSFRPTAGRPSAEAERPPRPQVGPGEATSQRPAGRGMHRPQPVMPPSGGVAQAKRHARIQRRDATEERSISQVRSTGNASPVRNKDAAQPGTIRVPRNSRCPAGVMLLVGLLSRYGSV
jgi:hypothetical protein